MAKNTSNDQGREGQRSSEATSLETIGRQRARGLIDAIVKEELEATLGASPSARVDDESGPDHLRDTARPRGHTRRRDGRMAQRTGASPSTPKRARG